MSVEERLAVIETAHKTGFQRIDDHFDNIMDELQVITKEVKRTNGRVTQLELKHAEQKGMVTAFRIMALIPTVAVSILTIVLGLRTF